MRSKEVNRKVLLGDQKRKSGAMEWQGGGRIQAEIDAVVGR